MGSLDDLREVHRLRVIDVLRDRGPVSRAALVEATGLSRTTIAAVLGELQASGFVVDLGAPEGAAGRGRPPSLLALDVCAGGALGIDFGRRHVHVAVADLASTVRAERRAELQARSAPLDVAVALVDEALAEAGIARERVVGAAVGLPGPVERAGALRARALLPAWSDVATLSERIGVPVEVHTDANLGALGELTYGAARGLEDVVYLRASWGIGAGIVAGGRLYHGASGLAGELGHVVVDPDGALCACGNRGCLGTVAGAGPLLELLGVAELPDLLALLAIGHTGAVRAVADAGRAIGRVLAALCNALNPRAVVVGGELAGTALIDGLREALEHHALPAAAEAVTVTVGALGDRAAVLGALAAVIGDAERLRSTGLVAV